jgi:hypothetical protein
MHGEKVKTTLNCLGLPRMFFIVVGSALKITIPD